jgi:hypothetical protein
MRKLFEITNGNGWAIECLDLKGAKAKATEHAGRPLHWITSQRSEWQPAEWYGYDRVPEPWEDDIDASAYRVRLKYERPDGTVTYHRR